jgi:hypothetical protein
MEMQKKVVTAIATAVHLYLQAQQQQIAAAAQEQRIAPTPGLGYSPWPIAGRQAAMEMRRLWQMRLVR